MIKGEQFLTHHPQKRLVNSFKTVKIPAKYDYSEEISTTPLNMDHSTFSIPIPEKNRTVPNREGVRKPELKPGLTSQNSLAFENLVITEIKAIEIRPTVKKQDGNRTKENDKIRAQSPIPIIEKLYDEDKEKGKEMVGYNKMTKETILESGKFNSITEIEDSSSQGVSLNHKNTGKNQAEKSNIKKKKIDNPHGINSKDMISSKKRMSNFANQIPGQNDSGFQNKKDKSQTATNPSNKFTFDPEYLIPKNYESKTPQNIYMTSLDQINKSNPNLQKATKMPEKSGEVPDLQKIQDMIRNKVGIFRKLKSSNHSIMKVEEIGRPTSPSKTDRSSLRYNSHPLIVRSPKNTKQSDVAASQKIENPIEIKRFEMNEKEKDILSDEDSIEVKKTIVNRSVSRSNTDNRNSNKVEEQDKDDNANRQQDMENLNFENDKVDKKFSNGFLNIPKDRFNQDNLIFKQIDPDSAYKPKRNYFTKQELPSKEMSREEVKKKHITVADSSKIDNLGVSRMNGLFENKNIENIVLRVPEYARVRNIRRFEISEKPIASNKELEKRDSPEKYQKKSTLSNEIGKSEESHNDKNKKNNDRDKKSRSPSSSQSYRNFQTRFIEVSDSNSRIKDQDFSYKSYKPTKTKKRPFIPQHEIELRENEMYIARDSIRKESDNLIDHRSLESSLLGPGHTFSYQEAEIEPLRKEKKNLKFDSKKSRQSIFAQSSSQQKSQKSSKSSSYVRYIQEDYE